MKYKIGDRVRIGNFKTKYPEKKQWQGKVMTIRAIQNEGGNVHSYVMKEDNAKNSWYEGTIKGLADEQPKQTYTEVLQLAIDTYGVDEQCRMINEEMAELTVALSKHHRNPDADTLKAVVEEIADVNIMIDQAAMMFGEMEVEQNVSDKVQRLSERLKDEQEIEIVEGKHKINGKTYT